MYIYIDNNVLIDYEDEKKELPLNLNITYVYSYVHLQELLEATDNLKIIQNVRIQTIKKLTRNKCVSHDSNNQLSLYEKDPSDVFTSVNSPLSRMCSLLIHQANRHWIIDDFPKVFIEELKIEKKVINNYTPEKLIEEYGEIIMNYIASTSNSTQEKFQSFFNILDAIGFWQDKVYKESTMNRSYDANHAYFATLCDYFVTNDRNTRLKANVAYRLYGFKTKAVSYEEFIKSINGKS